MTVCDINWCLITPEYSPTIGGVADYTRLVANYLAMSGQKVFVLGPSHDGFTLNAGFQVNLMLGKFGPVGLWRGSKILDQIPKPRRLFLQWVPHGFGFKSINLMLVAWIWWRVVVRRDRLWIMVHEPFLRFENSLRQRVAALIHRFMIWVLLKIADRVFAGNNLWVKLISYWAPKKNRIEWLPVPSNIPVNFDLLNVADIKARYSKGKILIGSFGTFNEGSSAFLDKFYLSILDAEPMIALLLIGKNCDKFLKKFLKNHPDFCGRIFAAGTLSKRDLSCHIEACDFFVQLNKEGISTRNGTLMAIISHGKTGVGNWGLVTDAEWVEWKGFFVVKPSQLLDKVKDLVHNPKEIQVNESLAKELYENHFSLKLLGNRLLNNC